MTPHHLTYTDEAVLGYRTSGKVLPPFREASDRRALREGLANGTIDCIATDHAPHTALEKDCEFAAAAVGFSSLETTIPMAWALVRESIVSARQIVAALSTGPAAILGLASELVGQGNLTVVAPSREWTVEASALRSKSHNTPLLGQTVQGRCAMTIVNGTPVYTDPMLTEVRA